MRSFFICFILLGFLQSALFCKAVDAEWKVDAVVFSYDRPLQLFAYLESAQKYVPGVNTTHVIYHASSDVFEEGYCTVRTAFPEVIFHKQQELAGCDFRSLVLSSVQSSPSPYMMFVVDDLIVTDYVDLHMCTKALIEHKAWGFFLRLGKNINHCYMLYRDTPCPKGQDLEGDLFSWTFSDGDGDWGYPNNTDMTIYRKRDVLSFLLQEVFTNPNTLEFYWQKEPYLNRQRTGLCFRASKNINIPLNLVNPSANRSNHSFSTQELLEKFQQGKKIDIAQFHKVNNRSPHVDYTPTFIDR